MMSPSSARKAEKLGYTNVKVFHGGMPTWKKARGEVISTVIYPKSMIDQGVPFVAVDLREEKDAEKAHIMGAVGIPANKIKSAMAMFPAQKGAPIVLYSDNTENAMDSFAVVRGWGYKNVSVLQGGMDAWLKTGNIGISGKLESKINYVPKPLPGVISTGEFKKIADTKPSDKFILDVRDEEEAMMGMLKGAKNIATQELQYRMDELPKNKEIIIHCITGVRAEMAYHALKEKGFNCRYLNASIEIDPDGNYNITDN
ncbi:MAG: hypothetical protein JSV21_03515 [Nitrospirota bacterium]|nr:MAG: hypothetical protein JSV21_03515 [Nitrospirota bacterium]